MWLEVHCQASRERALAAICVRGFMMFHALRTRRSYKCVQARGLLRSSAAHGIEEEAARDRAAEVGGLLVQVLQRGMQQAAPSGSRSPDSNAQRRDGGDEEDGGKATKAGKKRTEKQSLYGSQKKFTLLFASVRQLG